jgi:hypothetical protein
MNERKPSKREIRALGAHPDMMSEPSPALKDPNRMNFGLVPDIPVSKIPEPLVYYGPEKPHLQRWFKKGTKLYSLDFPVPRTTQEARDRLADELNEVMPLDIDMENLVWSKKLGAWREQPKLRHKAKLFGAFVIVDIISADAKGKQIITKRFVSLNDLQKPENNPLARFKMATQK